jgi:hypothetical protein
MSVVSAELKCYLAANMPEDDSSAVGGAINSTGRPLDDQFTAAAVVELDSDAAGDTQNVTVTGRLATGAIDSEVIAMNGTTAVQGAKSFERILKVVHASPCTGTVTLAQGAAGTVRHTFAAGEDEARSLFYGASAEAAGGSPVTRYEKVFVKNTNGSTSLTEATVELTNDPRSDYDIILEDAVDDNGSETDRLDVPTGTTGSFGDGPHDLPGDQNLDAGEAIGVWVRQVLAAGESPSLDEPQITLAGKTV